MNENEKWGEVPEGGPQPAGDPHSAGNPHSAGDPQSAGDPHPAGGSVSGSSAVQRAPERGVSPAAPEDPQESAPGRERAAVRWLKRLGVAGFLFFLVKGLLWLIVPALLVYFGVSC